MSRFFIIFFILFLFPDFASAGPIYVYKEADGAIRFTTKRPPAGVSAKVFTAKNPKFSVYKVRGVRRTKLFKNKYDHSIKEAATRYGVDSALIRAVIHAESAFNPKAVSHKGALGLMQLMPFNVRKFKVGDPFHPRRNILGGVELLSSLLKKYSGNVTLALAAYNAGENAVKNYNGVPPYSETQNYVRRVLSLKRLYSS